MAEFLQIQRRLPPRRDGKLSAEACAGGGRSGSALGTGERNCQNGAAKNVVHGAPAAPNLPIVRHRAMRELFLVASFGAAGAASRYGVGLLTQRLWGHGFAYGTLAVNLLGCFLLGFIMHVVAERELGSADLRAALGVGFLGAFTTFSTFGLETFAYLEERRFALAGANVAVNLLGGLLLVWAGASLARQVIGQ